MTVSERFLKYVSFGTNSDENSETCPSTESQLVLGAYIANELKSIGLCDVKQDENGYVYGFLPATPGRENDPAIGFIAHMDTSPAVKGDGIRPQITHYNGGDVLLGNGVSILYSVVGAAVSFVGMVLLKGAKVFSYTSVSVAGGVLHNMGQIGMACLLMGTDVLKYYAPFLVFSGTLAGIVIGLLAAVMVTRIDLKY